MINYEYNSQGTRLGRLWDRFNNWLAIDDRNISSVGYVIGFKAGDEWCWSPEKTGNRSLFYNGVFFIRLSAPFYIGIHIRWAGKDYDKVEFFQTGIGWKLNGRLGSCFRFSSDKSSAEGSHGPNVGQATGWDYGTK